MRIKCERKKTTCEVCLSDRCVGTVFPLCFRNDQNVMVIDFQLRLALDFGLSLAEGL